MGSGGVVVGGSGRSLVRGHFVEGKLSGKRDAVMGEDDDCGWKKRGETSSFEMEDGMEWNEEKRKERKRGRKEGLNRDGEKARHAVLPAETCSQGDSLLESKVLVLWKATSLSWWIV